MKGTDHRLREEEGPALEDRRMDAPAGRGGVPVRPRPAGLYDPLTEPCPPTPRADAFAAKAWEPVGASTSTVGPPGNGGGLKRSGTRK